MAEPSIDLYTSTGATSVHIRVYLKDGADVVVEGYDTGEAPKRQFGNSDYEYLVHVDASEKDKLLAALVAAAGKGARSTSGTPVFGWLLSLMPARAPGDSELDAAWHALDAETRDIVNGLDVAPKDKLVLALIKERYDGEARAVSLFSDFCYDGGVKAQFWSWNSG